MLAREFYKEAIIYGAFCDFDLVSDRLKADKEIACAAVEFDGHNLLYVSDELKADKEVVLTAVKNNAFALNYANYELKISREMILAAVITCGCYLSALTVSPLRFTDKQKCNPIDDSEIVLAAMQSCKYAILIASSRVKNALNLMQIPSSTLKSCKCRRSDYEHIPF